MRTTLRYVAAAVLMVCTACHGWHTSKLAQDDQEWSGNSPQTFTDRVKFMLERMEMEMLVAK